MKKSHLILAALCLATAAISHAQPAPAWFLDTGPSFFGLRANSQSLPAPDNGTNSCFAISGNFSGGNGEEDFIYTNTTLPGGFRFMRLTGASTYKDLMYVRGDGNVGIGTTNPSHTLSVNGTIQAKEIIVQSDWSDYVFAKNYKLASLSEVEEQIQLQGHLPGVPSAQEVAEKGVSVGNMESVLLAKIEELTLHQIAQEKELSALRTQVSMIKAENTR